jgi:glyoxylase-like metal-dependent hydrolase (beta-lactamase superfamily II)
MMNRFVSRLPVRAARTFTVRGLLLVAGAALVPVLHAQQPVGIVPLDPPPPPLIVDGIEILKVQGQVYMLAGAGGNVTAQIGSEGVLLVDAGGPGQSHKVVNALARLTPRQVRWLVNTSADADHVAGNGDIVKVNDGVRGPRPQQVGGANPLGQNNGVIVVSQENAYNRMQAGSKEYAAMTGDALPLSTFFTPKKEFFSNGEPIQVIAAPSAHTDGDAMVFFRGSDVISTGDVFLTTTYPVIDLAKGGSIQGVIDALNHIIDITVPERNQMGGTRVIPGHGRICNEADVIDYRDMVTIIRDRVRDMAKKGMTLQQIKAAKPSLEYDGIYGMKPGPGSTEAFLDTVYASLGKGGSR